MCFSYQNLKLLSRAEHEFVFSSHTSLAAFTVPTARSSQSNTKLWKVTSLLHVTKYQTDDAFSLDRSEQDSAIENNVFRNCIS